MAEGKQTLGLLFDFSINKKLGKLVDLAKKKDRQEGLARKESHKDSEQLRRTIDDVGNKLDSAIKQGNKLLVEQLTIQKNQLDIQVQQLDSQLRQEHAQTEERELSAHEDELFNCMWEVVEEAKGALRDRQLYLSLIYGVNARKAHKQLAPQVTKSDTKMKFSKLNDDVCEVLDKVLTSDNMPELSTEVIPITDGLKRLSSADSFKDFGELLNEKRIAISGIADSGSDLVKLNDDRVRLNQIDSDLTKISTDIENALQEFSQIEYVLTPFTDSSVREFLHSHLDLINNLKDKVQKSSNVNVDEVMSKISNLDSSQHEVQELQSLIHQKLDSISDKVTQAKSGNLRHAMKTANRNFYIIIGVGIIIIGIAQTGHKEGDPANPFATIIVLCIIGYWIWLRMKRKKVKAELGL